MKQIEVQIMGQSYLLGCPEGGEAKLRDAVERVDATMCRIRDAGKVRARDRIAVLASLNLAYDLGQQVATAEAAAVEAVAAAQAALSARDEAEERAQRQAVSPETTPTPDASQDRLDALVKRLDQALSGDRHLR